MPIDRELWLYAISALALAGFIWGLLDTRRIIEAPFIYAMGMLLLLVPQLYVISNNPWRVPDEAFWVFNIMVVLCTFAFTFGYFSRTKDSSARETNGILTRWVIDDRQLFNVGFAAAAIGSVGFIQVERMGEIEEWRGWPVYWITLAKLILPGISLMMIAYVQSKKIHRLVLLILLSIPPVLAILISGRRSATIILPIVYILPFLIYHRNFRVPRSAVIGFMVLVFIVVYAFPYWRGEFKYGGHLDVIEERPLSMVMEDVFSSDKDKVFEIIDGMIITGAHYRLNYYEWGVNEVYNSIIELYVPGGLIGHDVKNSLRIGEGVSIDWVRQAYGIPVVYYTAKSGYADLFAQFSFAGAMILFFVGKLFRRTYNAVVYRFDGRAIIILCFFITLPASISYVAFFYGLITQLPAIVVMWFAIRKCVKKRQFRINVEVQKDKSESGIQALHQPESAIYQRL